MLLNLSNHPLSEWSPRQLEAARGFGECRDMKFPAVPPTADEAFVAQLAQATAEAIRPLALTHTLTVHVMGEMGFTFSLVKILQRWGIRCIYSTSQRIAETLPDGSKRSTFHFERFREYERL